MNALPKVSLIIVSHNRPAELARVLSSLRYLDYPTFEVIVVSNHDPRALFPAIFGIEHIKFVPFERANISAARNLGINAAAGEIIAFCDDDAVPEPTWLSHLVAGFADPAIAAAGGYVRGRNGISFQWQGNRFDRFGNQFPLKPVPNETLAISGNAEFGVKTEGTNCAYRADTLRALGGFDESFCYYLDETDLNYRLGLAGWKTALVPKAEVHHRFAANDTRNRQRAPKDLFQIGASKAYFCKKHANSSDLKAELDRFQTAQRIRLIKFMLAGSIEPRDLRRIMPTLLAGYQDGLSRQPILNKLSSRGNKAFQAFPAGMTGGACLGFACRWWQWPKYRKGIKVLSARGYSVTVFRLSLSTMFHRMRFCPEGYWLQSGGIFGRAERKSTIFRKSSLIVRAESELTRLKEVRPIKKLSSWNELEALVKS